MTYGDDTPRDTRGNRVRAVPLPTTNRNAKEPAALVDAEDVCRGIRFGDEESGFVIPVPDVRSVYVVRDGRGDVVSRTFFLAASPDARNALPFSTRELDTFAYVDRLGIPIPADRTIREVVNTYLRLRAADLPEQDSTPRWEGDNLTLPPKEFLPAGYLERNGSEESAILGWREICRLATKAGAENAALNIGASFASPYVVAMRPLRPPAAMFFGLGETRKGKSTNVDLAAAVWGQPTLLNPALSESPIYIGEVLASLGVLPLFRDEAHSANWPEAKWKEHIMRSLNGASRGRAAREGGVTPRTRQWWGFQFLSGNKDIRYGATDGVRARVVTMHDPHMPDADTAEAMQELASRVFGWPSHWMVRLGISPSQFREKYADKAMRELREKGRPAPGAAATICLALSIAVGGAEILGELVGVPEFREAAIRAALRVLGTFEGDDEENSPNFGDQLLRDVWADSVANPGAYYSVAEATALYGAGVNATGEKLKDRDVRGLRDSDDRGEYLAVLPTVTKEIASRGEYDLNAALDDLYGRTPSMTERNIRDSRGGHKKQWQKKLGKTVGKFYMFRDPAQAAEAIAEAIAEATAPVFPSPELPQELPLPTAEEAVETARRLLGAEVLTGDDYELGDGYRGPDDEPEDADEELMRFARFATEYLVSNGEAEPTEEEIRAALAIWHEKLDGFRFDDYPGHLAVKFYRMKLARHAAMVRPTGMGESRAMLREVTDDTLRSISHVNIVDEAASDWDTVTGLDVNAQYLAAASSAPCGDGEPIIIENPLSVPFPRSKDVPGYVEIRESIETGIPAFGEIVAGEYVPLPLAKYLHQKGIELPARRLIVWEEYGTRLSAWAKPFAQAYRELSSRKDRPARIAIAAMKKVYSAFFAGQLRSDRRNNTEIMNYSWSDMVVATAEANMLRALDREVKAGGKAPIGTHKDTAYFAGLGIYEPRGLQIERVPGKWKIERVAPMNDEILGAYFDESIGALRDAVNAADRERRAGE